VSTTVAAERGTDSPAWREDWLQRLRQWLPALRYCAVVYLVVRIALFLLAAAAWGLSKERHSSMPNGVPLPLTNGWHNMFTDWDKLDANWFQYIAQYGYSRHNATGAFYPGYPMLVRLVGYLCGGHLLLAGYLVSNLALLAALVLLYRLTELEYDQASGRRAVLYLAIYPTAVFLFGLYSESLFLLFAVGAFYLARRGHWWWAGVVGIGATLTRSIGVVIALALAVEAVHQTVEDRRRESQNTRSRLRLTATLMGRLACSAVPLAGTAGYLLFWQLRYHDWNRSITLEKTWWGRTFTPPWESLWHGYTLALQHAQIADGARWTYDFVFVATGLVLGIWVAVRTRPVYAVYTWGSILGFLSESVTGRPLVSDARYMVTLFPLVWTMARLGRRPGWHEALVALSAASMAIVSWLFLTTKFIL
jgi:Mannosyltransferase (PIG-V)